MMKATATQNSASNIDFVSVEHVAHGLAKLFARRQDACQPLDNGACRLDGDAAQIRHCRGASGCDRLLRLGNSVIELRVYFLAAGAPGCSPPPARPPSVAVLTSPRA